MGYETQFQGIFEFDRPLDKDTIKQLKTIYDNRHGDNIHQNEDYPSYYCQWLVNDSGTFIEWDGGEKFYGYIGWLKYIVKHVLEPNGYALNGEVKYRGEDFDDVGSIKIENNNITWTGPAIESYSSYEPPEHPSTKNVHKDVPLNIKFKNIKPKDVKINKPQNELEIHTTVLGAILMRKTINKIIERQLGLI